MSDRRICNVVCAAIIIWLVGCGLCPGVIADAAPQATSPVTDATPQKTSKTITIKADTYGYSGNLLKAEGDVSVVDGDMALHADIMSVKTTRIDDKLTYEQVIAQGKSKPVTLKSADGTASGQTIDYNVLKGLAELTGKAEITFSNGGRLSGADKIIMNRGEQSIRTVGGHPRALIPHTRKVAEDKGEEVSSPAAATIADAPTEITSKEITYDMAKGVVAFTGSVHVIDDEMDLKGESLKVFRNKEGKASRIVLSGGEGLVRISNAQGSADGPSAEYDLISGVLTLNGKANLRTVNGMVFKNADSVLYNRDKKEFLAKGGSIDISNTGGGSLKDMLKPPAKDTKDKPSKPTLDKDGAVPSRPLGK